MELNRKKDEQDFDLDIQVKNIMEMSLLERISELAYLCFPPSEIALLCGLDPEEFQMSVSLKATDQAKAYWAGKLRYKLKQRLVIHTSALRGSLQDAELMKKFLGKQEEEENA